jgi:hypothetical protein
MEQFGIKFKMKDGTTGYYDPLVKDDLKETNNHYILNMAYIYDVPKEDVEYFEWYELCEICGYELFEEGCRNCAEKEELKNL